ncbi:MAG: hypothetical protein A2268_10915 [Candidatus Raymondbacteria bacterium RifOxyA12_full_50_37]|nr:MAG: hypothetical protein A2268_10915 [Candidatus Raymondbacteria bacterium RifOxyA12_full_50_37]OGJ85522.1 MAG: hypothetical protein A2248_12700 [Candidatus Raymondbacteria bacterium RIFOXYA2_FULL_49_16]OGJ95025.1 MAG: hypothetical protein A2453_07400 [Candidatus Raymondbacteria bacterium RIFOXYC2_FULL_50_21]OGK02670.1 MAG: hypothetical protein A2350_07135 [Candidatus Raymondbacteria bacterium RifOxyB12_full_50_8]OGK07457.1 MAG: hypothetical protein A2487_18875 [Candidatus Raymondbacteria b
MKRTPSLLFYGTIGLFMAAFLAYPLWGVFERAFFFTGSFSPGLFLATLSGSHTQQILINSCVLGFAAVLLSACIAVPLAFFIARYDFTLKRVVSGLVLVPMILPPFVGAIGIQRIFARHGLVNMVFDIAPFDWFSWSGFWGVAFLQALHLFPIMYLNMTAALANIDQGLEEAAKTAGAKPFAVFKDITLPLALPGFFSGAVIVFLWSFTDLGTPLVLGFRQVVAVEIFDRSTAINNDPSGPALVVCVILVTALFMGIMRRFSAKEVLGGSKGSRGALVQKPSKTMLACIYGFFLFVLCLSLLPHFGLVLTSLAKDWFMTALPAEYTLDYFETALSYKGIVLSVKNSLVYSSCSTLIDVVFGLGLAWFLVRKKVRGAWLIDAVVMLPIALPGIILAFGYLAAFSGTILDPLQNPAPLLIIGYAVRRLPYSFRAAYAGLQQVSPEFEEAAQVSGAGSVRTITTITVPLIGANIVAGAILAFIFALLEVSESMILAVKEQFFPLTREIYHLLGKIPDGDYIASALGVLCMFLLAAGLAGASAIMGKHLGKMFRV